MACAKCLPFPGHFTTTCSNPHLPLHTGANSFGELGQGDQLARWRFAPIEQLRHADIVTLQAGDHNSGAIGADGRVYLWGR